MKKYLFFLVFVSLAQLFYGQTKYTIQGELPDHSLDNSYLRFIDSSALSEEKERMKHLFIDSILVVDGKFYYEGVLSKKPFLAYLSSVKGRRLLNLTTSFIVEPGNIHIRIANWTDEAVVSGTPINEDYYTYFIAPKRDKEKRLFFLEKYAQYPDVVRFHLSIYLNKREVSKDPDFPKYLQIINRMPEEDRDILLGWLDYTIKKREYDKKVQPLLDSIRNNAPRFIETVSNRSLSTTMKNAQNDKLYIYWPDFDKDETICGYIDSKGKIVIPAGKYADIFTAEFDKVAIVKMQGRKEFYAIDRNEKVLFQVYNYEGGPDIISNGLLRIIEKGEIGFANMNGEIVITPNFGFIFPFQENALAIFCEKGDWIWIDKEHQKFSGGKWGAMDTKGNIVIPAMYDDGKENYLKKDGKWCKVRKDGKLE